MKINVRQSIIIYICDLTISHILFHTYVLLCLCSSEIVYGEIQAIEYTVQMLTINHSELEGKLVGKRERQSFEITLQKDLQEHSSLSATTGLFQDAPDHKSFEELKELAQDRKLWRTFVVAIKSADTLVELEKRKKARKTRSSGATNTMDLDASQWFKGVNKERKFDGGLRMIAK